MRVLFDATNVVTAPTGAGLYTYHVLRELDALGCFFDTTVLVRKDLPQDHPIFSLHLSFQKIGCGAIGPRRDLMLSLLLARLRGKFDAFFCFMPYLPMWHTHRTSLVVVHDVGHLTYPYFTRPWHRGYFSLVLNRTMRRARHICTVSQTTQEEIQRRWSVPKERISVAYCNTALPEVSHDGGESPLGRPYLLYVGERRPHKNIERLIKAFVVAKKDSRVPANLALVCVGKDYGEHTSFLKQIVQEQDIARDVIIQDPVSESELVNLYTHASALALVSLYEGFGMPLIEAMQYEIPIFTSDRSAMREIAGGAAYLVNPEDEEAIARGIVEVITNSELRADLVARGRVRRAQFSWRRTAETVRDALLQFESH